MVTNLPKNNAVISGNRKGGYATWGDNQHTWGDTQATWGAPSALTPTNQTKHSAVISSGAAKH